MVWLKREGLLKDRALNPIGGLSMRRDLSLYQSCDQRDPWILPEEGLSYGGTAETWQKSQPCESYMPKDRDFVGPMSPRVREDPG